MSIDKDLVVISDIHYAKEFDYLEQIIPEYINFINPKKNLKKVLKKLKDSQALIINGDIVNYYFQEYLPKKEKKSNWDLFWKEIEKNTKNIPIWCNLGNHDYRKSAYNYNFWPLDHFGIPKNFAKANKKLLKRFKFRGVKEISSISVNLKKFDPLQKYSYEKNYKVKNGEQILVFLDTGYDNLNSYKLLFRPLRKLLEAWKVSSYGLSKTQIKFLKSCLYNSSYKEVIILLHTPLFRNHGSQQFKFRNREIQYLLRKKLIQNLWGNGSQEFLEIISQSNLNIIVVASHLHEAEQYIYNKESKIFRKSDMEKINNKRCDERLVKFVNTLAIGARDKKGRSGYLNITNKKLEHIII